MTCSTSGTSEVYEMGRRVLQVEHWRFMYRTVSRDGTTRSTSGTSEVYVQDSV